MTTQDHRTPKPLGTRYTWSFPRMPLERGTRLGPYQIESPIGAGGMGEVYKATDTRLERTVAIKVLPAHVASDPERKSRFEREAKTVAALSHPHIGRIHGSRLGPSEGR